MSSRLNNLLIGFSLFIGGVMMLVVLSHFLRYRAATRQVAPPSAPAPTGTVARAIPADLAARVATWRQLPDTIIEVENLQQRKLMEQAEARLQTALAVHPAALSLHLALARLRIETARPAEAVEPLAAALEAEPSNLEARHLLATALDQLGEYGMSRQVAEWILEADPYSSEAHRIAAAAFLKSDQPRAALPHLRKIANLEFDNPDVQGDLAEAYSLAGEHDKAIDMFENILRQEPSNALAWFNLVVCYARQAKTNEAVEALNRAAASLGTNRVSTWIAKPEFDSLRGHPAFQVPANAEETIAPPTDSAEPASSTGG
ncbi:MAG: tetratricopeptide repeat protein [Verrucomicrobia bacterium]|nr:tetratricopeptide repeat protein [Verrucomicrobiota bacterium]